MRNLFYFVIAILTLASCSKEDNGNKEITVTGGQLKQVVYADNTESKSGVSFITTGAWTSNIVATRADVPDWVSISPSSGGEAGNYTINITLAQNFTGSKRSATINIICNGSTISITVSQEGTTQAGEKPVDQNGGKTVYVVGYDNYYNSGTLDSYRPGVATMWKNGVATSLTDGSNDARANSVFASGDDVYIAGTESLETSPYKNAKLWKNGVATTLSGETNYNNATSVFVSGNDVYVAGYGGDSRLNYWGDVGKLWKNGTESLLTDYNDWDLKYKNIVVTSLYVSGSTTYVIGYDHLSSNRKLWINGMVNTLSGFEYPRSVFVSGTDVYIVGSAKNTDNKNVAILWKNEVTTSLTDGKRSASANSIFVSGNDVYIVGFESNGTNNVAKLWKNGIATSLTDGTQRACANSVFVSGSDVYVAGYEYHGDNSVAKLWKNGVATSLSDGTQNAEAHSVFVK